METEKVDINQKIAEIKKRILLAEGQKTANLAEWQKQNRINCDTISTLKKEIKELTVKCGRLRNPLQRSVIMKETAATNAVAVPGEKVRKTSSALPTIVVGKVSYPIGARNVDDAIFLTDLKITENRKQLDLLRHRFKCRKQHFAKLMEQYRELVANKEAQEQNLGEKPPETLEEDNNRKLVCQLENQIHRTNVQWMEAEHIRKKYRSIEASLMNDAERFEKSLRELEVALSEQQQEINRLQEIHNEAIEMRDSAKVILQRQEHQANISQKTRERQAMEFRKLVEQRKMELERIGRKLFFEGKTLHHQDSIGSSSGEPHTGKPEAEEDENSQLKNVTGGMEELFKNLMEVSGATSPHEVFERFSSQKESALRLNYLRAAAEAEKNSLEQLRENLTKELESSKFSDVKEKEVNQEVIEHIKSQIADYEIEREKNLESAEKTMDVLKFIKDRLCEMIYKLQEVNETKVELKDKDVSIQVQELPDFLVHKAEDRDLIQILKYKLEKCQELNKLPEEMSGDKLDLDISEEEFMMALQPPKSPSAHENEKPAVMPMCYYNLLAGRNQRATGTLSSSPEQAPAAAAAGNEEESEVPSRNFLKRQSVLIVDSKSRRKPFRAAPAARRK
ncbi:golgin subfamily A member 6-like protein 7 [Musca domestica]|uniref:Golgin subfamily A member 6-like protein 7 n=1 Tax=Musca domestica TaxID=7370 RepID=A0ABM3UT19_MUSDO|nr:golgin subfamily A member 6-like protein 7 [Musca domestica]